MVEMYCEGHVYMPILTRKPGGFYKVAGRATIRRGSWRERSANDCASHRRAGASVAANAAGARESGGNAIDAGSGRTGRGQGGAAGY